MNLIKLTGKFYSQPISVLSKTTSTTSNKVAAAAVVVFLLAILICSCIYQEKIKNAFAQFRKGESVVAVLLSAFGGYTVISFIVALTRIPAAIREYQAKCEQESAQRAQLEADAYAKMRNCTIPDMTYWPQGTYRTWHGTRYVPTDYYNGESVEDEDWEARSAQLIYKGKSLPFCTLTPGEEPALPRDDQVVDYKAVDEALESAHKEGKAIILCVNLETNKAYVQVGETDNSFWINIAPNSEEYKRKGYHHWDW